MISILNLKKYFSYDEDTLRRILYLIVLSLPFLIIIGRSPLDIAVSIIAISFVIYSIFWNDYIWLKSKWVQAIFIFWIFIVLNSLLAYDVNLALARSVPFIRFPLFAIAVSYWIIRNEQEVGVFVFVFIATIVFSFTDGIFEFLVGFDFSGNQKAYGRLSGPFEKSGLGIFLAKMGIPMVLAFWAITRSKSKRFDYLAVIILVILSFTVFVAGERMAVLLLSFALVIGIYLIEEYRKYLLTILLIFVTGFGFALFFNKEMQNRIYMTTMNEIQSDPKKQSAYKAQLSAAIEIIKDHPILGVGSNNYRFVCKKPKYDPLGTKEWSRCLIHPHHVYLELWVNNGIIGLSLFLVVIYFWLKLFFKHRPDQKKDYLLLSGSLGLLLFLWPLSVGMSIFSNFNGIWFWVMIAFMLTCYRLRTGDPYIKKGI